MQRLLRKIHVGALSVVLTSTVAWAQLSTAELNGRVTDESGAVLPGVTVTVVQTDTGFTRTVETDGTGSYVLPNLPTGPYRLEVLLQGFRSYVQTGIVLQVAATPTINVVMALGNLEETVSVEAATPLVDVRSAGISAVVENERILELPLQGRQVTDLIILAGGAVQTGAPTVQGFQGAGQQISVAGGLDFGVAFLLDGAMHNDPQSGINLPLPFPDAMQEFRVATSGLSAQNGMHGGTSVNAVTKSGTNRFSGNFFEFLRDKRFNATNVFAQVGADGKRKDDGLKRNQFGGTFGGPILRDRVFFFGAYQGTATRQAPADNIAWVPTAAMMAGDFTTFASPLCNGGRQITLRAGFVNNRIDPARFSPAAVNLANRLPKTDDPCGRVTFGWPDDNNEGQAVGKIDYQLNADHSVFTRYIATFLDAPGVYGIRSDNILTTPDTAYDNLAQSLTLGDTLVFGANMVNSLRVAFNRTAVNRNSPPFFQNSDLGVKVYSYVPQQLVLRVNAGFAIGTGSAIKGYSYTNSYQVADDFTLVRGRHQMAMGMNAAFVKFTSLSNARAGGDWMFDGAATGLGLADFLMGRVAVLEHSAGSFLPANHWYLGLYAQDTWRATEQVTLNAGLRWEPYFGQQLRNGAVYNFDVENFRNGVRSTRFHNAPTGLIYYGDRGFPSGKSGHRTQWWNLSPRAGLAWDVTGDGRVAVRASYALAYDFPTMEYMLVNAAAPPFSNRLSINDPPGLFDDPYEHLGGDPHPIVTGPDTRFVPFGGFGPMNPDINSPRVQTWNVTVERQLATDWGVSVSYLGSYSDRLWNLKALNPGVYLGLDPCTINGVFYPMCSINGNLNNRRRLYLENPREAQFIGTLDLQTDVGKQDYRGLKLSVQRRGAGGVSLNGNYTWSRCFGNATQGRFSIASRGYVNPDDPAFDRGHCSQDRTHLATLTVGAQTPQFENAALRPLASDWRVSGILTARSGAWLDITTGRDNAFSGMFAQRPNRASYDVYGNRTLTNYLNPSAFAQPANGTLGDLPRNAVKGPGFWTVDLALSRLVRFAERHSLEFRVEAFNLLNNFNWGNPNTNFGSGLFGRITSQTGSSRIMQFGVKYGF